MSLVAYRRSMGSARSMLVATLFAAGCSRPQPGPSPLPAEWVARGGGPGPAIGEVMPPFELADQDGRPQTFATLRGPNGLLLNFNRSVVW